MTLAEILAQLLPQANSPGAQAGVAAAAVDATPAPRGSSPSSIAIAPPPPRQAPQSEPSSIAGGPLALAQREIPDRPVAGSAYTPPEPAPAPGNPITTGSVAPRTPAPLGLPERSEPGIGERIGGFLAGLSGPDSLAAYQGRGDKARDREMNRFAQNQTYQALVAKGLDEDTARAAVTNPELLKAVIPNVFGGAPTDDWREYQKAKQEGFGGNFIEFKQQTKRTNTLMKVDGGTEWHFLDPVTREVVQTLPKNIAGAAQQKALGTARGDAQAGLPRAVETATNMLQQIDGVLQSGALGRSVGPFDQFRPSVSGGATDFDARLSQLKGQSFLQAFQSLKGGGAITEVEGQKATDAIGRLSKAQDEQTFRLALQDLRDVVMRGLARAEAQARGDTSGASIPGSEITRQAAPGTIRTYNPATGRLE